MEKENVMEKPGGIGFLLVVTLFSWVVFAGLAYALGLI